MKLEAACADRTYSIEVSRSGEQFLVRIGERALPVRLLNRTQGRWTLEIEGRIHDVVVNAAQGQTRVEWQKLTFPIQVYSRSEKMQRQTSELEIAGIVPVKAQMPGKVISVLVREQEEVEAGQGLAVIEAMKMQNELRSPKKGKVLTCRVQKGGTVNAGELLFEIG